MATGCWIPVRTTTVTVCWIPAPWPTPPRCKGSFGGVTLNQSSTTGADGSAGVSIIYPQDHASWVAVEVTASATVQGTQSSTSTKFWLPMLAADITSPSVTPPGQVSPYGVAATCINPN